jgi:hypothetical protein
MDWSTTASDLNTDSLQSKAKLYDSGTEHSFEGHFLLQPSKNTDTSITATKVYNGQRMTSDLGISLATAEHLNTPLHLHPSLVRLNELRDRTIRGANYKITQMPK